MSILGIVNCNGAILRRFILLPYMSTEEEVHFRHLPFVHLAVLLRSSRKINIIEQFPAFRKI